MFEALSEVVGSTTSNICRACAVVEQCECALCQHDATDLINLQVSSSKSQNGDSYVSLRLNAILMAGETSSKSKKHKKG